MDLATLVGAIVGSGVFLFLGGPLVRRLLGAAARR